MTTLRIVAWPWQVRRLRRAFTSWDAFTVTEMRRHRWSRTEFLVMADAAVIRRFMVAVADIVTR